MKTKARIPGAKHTPPRAKNQPQTPPPSPLAPDFKKPGIEDFCLTLFSVKQDQDLAQIEITPAQFQAMQQFAALNGQSLNEVLADTLQGVAETWQDEITSATQPKGAATAPAARTVHRVKAMEDAVNQALARPQFPDMDLELAVKKSGAFMQLMVDGIHRCAAEHGTVRNDDFYQGLEHLAYLVQDDLTAAQTTMDAELVKAKYALLKHQPAPVAVNGGAQ